MSPEHDSPLTGKDRLDLLDRDQQPPTAEEAGSYLKQLRLDRALEPHPSDCPDPPDRRFDPKAFAAMQPVAA